MLQNHLKIAWRNLFKNKVFSIINIAGLSVGMAVTILIGLWIHDEVTYDTYHANYDSLARVMINQTFDKKTDASFAIAFPLGNELRTKYASDFKHVAMGSWDFEYTLAVGETRIIKEGMYAEPDFPKMLTLDMLAGRYEDALKDPNSILLSESVAQVLFGEENPLGKIVRVDNTTDVQVTGIFADLPFNSSFREVTFYMPWSLYVLEQEWVRNAQDQWGSHSFQAFVQVNNAAQMQQISDKIASVERAYNENGDPKLFLHPMSKWHLYGEFKDGVNIGGRIQFVWLFGIIGLFVLLLACINFMNLSTARSEKRAKEVGVRKTVGSLQGQLIGQFLSESLLITFLASLLAVTIVQLSLPAFNELAGKEVRILWSEPVFWLLIAGFILITGIVAGSYPAFYLSSFQPLRVLKGTFRAGPWASVPRKVLVVLQFTVSIILIIGTIIVFNQIQHAKNRPVGYDRDGLLTIYMTPDLQDKYDALRNELLRTGAVEEMSESSSPVTNVWSNQIGFDWEGKDPEREPIFGIVACTHDYGNTLGWKIKEGRDFSRDFSTDTSALILNEAAKELIGIEDIVGKTIRWDDDPYQVIGVIENMVMESPYTPIKPTIFAISYSWTNVINIKLKPGMPVQDALSRVEGVFKTFNPGSPFDYNFADEDYEEKFRAEQRIGKLASVFAALAIFISCLGLLGLSAYVAEQRAKEIGIRKVLGANIQDIVTLLSKDFLWLVLIAIVIATPIAWWAMNDWLQDYTYRIHVGWWVFAITGIGALLIALVTVSSQAIRAAVANPVDAIKSE
ncbi:MAG: ABC transporter permease [Saprospiraceae bacterium]|nr:ABC transporter permease [Saprospiraceae bacterium]